MSQLFREFVQKIGSGTHTHQDLTREEACMATQLILNQEATPAQIGAFMIAHRIKRPTGAEIAGMLDAYDRLGPRLSPIGPSPLILSTPYDGRIRSIPLSPIISVVLASASCPVITHGGERMPTKHGIPLVEVWRHLGVNWRFLSLSQVQSIFASTGVGFVFLPEHFPLAQGIVPYREQIGKRPPFATVEMLWSPYKSTAHVVAGFVHPPTEAIMRAALALRGATDFTTIKGVEGSGELPRDRTAIVGIGTERAFFNPLEYGFGGKEVPLPDGDALGSLFESFWQGNALELHRSVVWTSGFYLWRAGAAEHLNAGFDLANRLIRSGQAQQKLTQLQKACENRAAVF